MSGEIKGAARRTDLVEHGSQMGEATAMVATAAINVVKTAWYIYRIAKYGAILFTGPAGALAAIALDLIIEYGISKPLEEQIKVAFKKKHTGIPGISTGSPNVFVNKLEAARGNEKDKTFCHTVTEQGSKWVSYNKEPACRLEDMTKCPGNIGTASTNVGVGGPPTKYVPYRALQLTLLLLDAYSAAKLGVVKGATAAGGRVTNEVLRQGLREGRNELLKGSGKHVLENDIKPWAKEQGLWPW